MSFVIRIPSIGKNINGNKLALAIGGIRSYNLENLYSLGIPEQTQQKEL